MRFIEPEFFPGCIGAWCPSVTRTARYLIDHSDRDHRLDLVGVTNSNLFADGLGVSSGRAVSPDLVSHLTPPQLTFSCWVNPTTLSGTTYVGGSWRTSGNVRCFMMRFEAAAIHGFFSPNGSSAVDLDGGSTGSAGSWRHVAISIGPAGAKIYRLGRVTATDALTATHTGDARFTLGTITANDPNPFGSNLQGRIDDIQLYNRQLSDEEVFELSRERAGLYLPRRFRRSVSTDKITVVSTLVLTHEVANELVSGREAESTLELSHDVTVGGPLTVDASSALNLQHVLDVAGTLNAVAGSNLELDHDVHVEGPIDLDASNSLALTQGTEFFGPKSAAAQSILDLLSSARIPEVFIRSASNSLAVTQTAVNSGTLRKSASNQLTLASEGDTSIKLRFPSSELVLDHDVDVVKSIHAKHVLNLTHEVDLSIQVTATSHLVALISRAEVPHSGFDFLALSQAVGVQLPPQTRFAQNSLAILQSALVTGDFTKPVASTLNLLQAVSYSTTPRLCHYSPFVGGGSMPTSIPPADDSGFTKGLKLEHGDDELTLSRSMSYGDINRLTFDRINRTSRGGTLLVFADPIWPKLESLVFSVSGVKRTEARAFLDFLEPRVGQQMTLTTHEGRQWLGVVMNPQESVIQDGHNSYTLSIEFQGVEV